MDRYEKDIENKAVVSDCIGGCKGYAWSGGGQTVMEAIGTDKGIASKYGSNGCPDYGANSMFNWAKKKDMDWGTIGTLPEIPGLALVKEVVDQHRGNVTVESVLGEGSTFTMNIPLASDDMELTGPVKISRDARKQAKAAKREQDKRRKEQEKLRRLQERQEKSAAASGQQLTLFGIRVPLPTIKKDTDEDEK